MPNHIRLYEKNGVMRFFDRITVSYELDFFGESLHFSVSQTFGNAVLSLSSPFFTPEGLAVDPCPCGFGTPYMPEPITSLCRAGLLRHPQELPLLVPIGKQTVGTSSAGLLYAK